MISVTQTSIREKKRRAEFKSSENRRRHYKFIKINAHNLGFTVIKTLTKNRTRNLCLISGHAHSVYSGKFRLSRHQVKKYFTFITGLRNSSW